MEQGIGVRGQEGVGVAFGTASGVWFWSMAVAVILHAAVCYSNKLWRSAQASKT